MTGLRRFKIVLLALFMVAGTGCVANADEDITFGKVTVEMNNKTYQLEYAETFEQRAQGLMFRKELCDDCGMLFRFSPPKQASMWMKNTYIPLDVAFIDRNGVITDIKPLQPHDLTSVGTFKLVTYALEMNQGWFAAHKIKAGDQIIVNL